MTDLNIKIVKKYLTIIMVGLAILIIGMNIVLIYSTLSNTVKVHIEYSSYEINNFSEDIERKIMTNKKIGSQIILEPVIADAINMRSDDIEGVVERLNFYKATDYYIESIYVYNANADCYYTSTGSIKSYGRTQIKNDGDIHKLVEEYAGKKAVILRKKDNMTVYTFFVKPYTYSQCVVVLNYYTNYFSIDSSSDAVVYKVIDTDGDVVISSNKDYDSGINAKLLTSTKDVDLREPKVIFIDGSVVVCLRSNELLYCYVTPWLIFMRRVLPVIVASILCCLIMIVLVAVSFSNGMKWIFNKFSQFYFYAEFAKTEVKQVKALSEIAILKSYLIDSGSVNAENMNTKINRDKPIKLYSLYISELRRGRTKESQKERKALSYAVGNVLEEIMGNVNADIVEMSYEEFVVICNSDDSEKVYERILKTKSTIYDILQMQIAVIKQRGVTDLQGLPEVYFMIGEVREKCFYKGYDSVMNIEDYWNEVSPEVDTEGFVNSVIQALKDGDEKTANAMLQEDNVIRFSVYDSRRIAEHLCKKLDLRCAEIAGQKSKQVRAALERVLQLIETNCCWADINDGFSQVFEMFTKITQYNDDEYSREVYVHIVDIIKKEYAQDYFCRDYLAEQIKMSVKSMEQIFKKYEDKSITNYVFSYRMSEAKRMLDETDFAVKEIAGKIGYPNVSHFIQNFKKTYGMTPDKYRKMSI